MGKRTASPVWKSSLSERADYSGAHGDLSECDDVTSDSSKSDTLQQHSVFSKLANLECRRTPSSSAVSSSSSHADEREWSLLSLPTNKVEEPTLETEESQSVSSGGDGPFDETLVPKEVVEAEEPIDRWDLRAIVGVLLAFGVLIIIKLSEERYALSSQGPPVTFDPYSVLGVERSASKRDIEKAYRTLSRQLHPDRRRDCVECVEKFQELAEAYALLSDKRSREAFDRARTRYSAIASATVQITAETYNLLLSRSKLRREVWVIQIYSDHDWLSTQIAPVWEETAETLGRAVKFGRINGPLDTNAVTKLPVKIRAYPAILMLSAYLSRPLIYQGIYDLTATSLRRWIIDSFPKAYISLHSPRAAIGFLNRPQRTPRALIISPRPLSLLFQSRILQHAVAVDFAFILAHEANGLFSQLRCQVPEKNICVVVSDGVGNDAQTFTVSRAEDAETSQLFLSLRRAARPWLTAQSAPLLCGEESRGSICIGWINQSSHSPNAVRNFFTIPAHNDLSSSRFHLSFLLRTGLAQQLLHGLRYLAESAFQPDTLKLQFLRHTGPSDFRVDELWSTFPRDAQVVIYHRSSGIVLPITSSALAHLQTVERSINPLTSHGTVSHRYVYEIVEQLRQGIVDVELSVYLRRLSDFGPSNNHEYFDHILLACTEPGLLSRLLAMVLFQSARCQGFLATRVLQPLLRFLQLHRLYA